MTKEESAGAVVFFGDGEKREYLILHYQAGHWDFPKGHIEEGESKRDTVIREISEETGITDLEFVAGFEVGLSYWFKKKKEWLLGKRDLEHKPNHRLKKKEEGAIFKEVTFFLTKTNSQNVTISFEHLASKWLPYKRALEQITFDGAKDILREADAFL